MTPTTRFSASVGAAVGARHAAGDLGEPMTARDSSTAKGNARFFAVEAGAAGTFARDVVGALAAELLPGLKDL